VRVFLSFSKGPAANYDVRGILLIGLAFACLQASAFGQAGTGEIVGTVRDATGSVLPDVVLTFTHQGSSVTRELKTDANGAYVAASLPVGVYSIKAELANFKSRLLENVALQVGRQERVDVELEIGERTDIVIVRDAAPLLRSANAEVSEVVSNQRIISLPLNGRQFVDLSLLSDNVFRSPRGTRGSALAQTGAAVLVAGQRAGHNMYYLDGVSVTDQYFNHLVASPPIDSLQEFNIQKTIYPAEFGGKASATISSVIKSGTNGVHGSLYEFFRNEVLDARNFFDPTKKPPYRQNQFGATLGGPVVKDRTFYFLSYEGLLVRQAQTQTFSVPTSAVRAGDFSGLPAIYDPLSTDAGGRRTAFLNNRIPTPRLDPVALAFMEKLPLPNLPGQAQNYLATPTLRNDVNQGVARLDQRLGAKDNFFGRVYIANFDTFQPFGSSLLNETLVPGFGYFLTTHSKSFGLGEVHVFSPGIVNEFRFGFLRVAGGQQSQNQGINFAAQNGIGGIAPAADQTGYPSMNFSGAYSTAGDPANLFTRRNNSFDFIETLSWVKGSHSMKFGGYIYRLQFNPSESPNARGSFTYTPRYTSSAAGLGDGSAFGDFLLGYPSSAQAGIGPGGSEYGRSTWIHLYAQDDWRISRSLTFNYGLRYEINGKITDTQNRLSAIETGRFVIASDDDGKINPLANGLIGLIPIPWVTSKDAGYHRSLQLPNYRHIAPRTGLAWSIKDKTVLRAGWGLFFNQAAYNIQTVLTENLPFYFNKSVNTAATTLVPTLRTSNILTANANGTIGGSTMDYPYRTEFANNWSLDIQRVFARNWVVSANYLGSHIQGADNNTFRNIPLPGSGPIDARRPNPLISGFRTIRWDGWSIYYAGTLRLEKRLSSGLILNANYTWSKAMDDASDVGGTFSETNTPQDVRNVRAEKALSSFDHRHRFVYSFSYAIPSGSPRNGIAGKLAQGWTVAGLGSAQSGAPFTINIPTDNANIGTGPAQRPDLVGDPNRNAPHTAQQWFNTSVFRTPQQFTFGNAGRNVVFADNEISIDASVMKDTSIKERTRIQIRAEMFNILNHTNFADVPGRTAFTPTFGRYTAAQNPRQVQFALKLLF
jgi:hypothetical protein